MMEEQIRRMVTKVIDATQPHPFRYYHLCWWQDGIRCLRVHHTTEPHPVFLTMVGQVLTAGLSPRQWRILTHRILHFCQATDVTLNRLSPRSRDTQIPRPIQSPQVTNLDCRRLQDLLTAASTLQTEIRPLLELLQRLLETADVVPAEDIAPDVVTMNSQVRLWDHAETRETVLSLVFPPDARSTDLDRVKLSILSYMGLSLLGRRVGDVVGGCMRIDKLLYQPEAAGHFDR